MQVTDQEYTYTVVHTQPR